MTKILNFEKIITQINSLKNDFLDLDKLVIYAENLDKILQNKNQSKMETNLDLNLEPNLETNLELKLELKLFLSSHDFLVLELSHFWLQNQYTLGTNSVSREKKIWTKWQNLLENIDKLTTKLQKIKQNKLQKENGNENENCDKITDKNENNLNLNLKTLLIDQIIKTWQKMEQKLAQNLENQTQNSNKTTISKLTFWYKKNLIEVSLCKNNWNLKTYFDGLITANFTNTNLTIQTNLEKTDFEELQKICGFQILPNLLIYASPSLKIAKIGKKLFGKNYQQNSQQKLAKHTENFENYRDFVKNKSQKQTENLDNLECLEDLEIEDNFVSSFNLEIFLDQKLNEIKFWENQNTQQNIVKNWQLLERQNSFPNPIQTQNSVQSLKRNSQILTTKKIINQTVQNQSETELLEKMKSIIVIVCGQNSTLKDCSQIVVSHSKFDKKFLILGESGSLTKIASKIETFSGFLIVKMSDLLHLLEVSTLHELIAEIWIINQPFLRLDNFWSPINHEKLKEFNLQAQINFLEKTCNCQIYFVKTYWK